MDSVKSLRHRPDEDVAIYYLWDFQSPLRVYLDKNIKIDTTVSYFKRWASVAPLYAAYGNYLIKNHPTEFIKYYAWPNLVKYYAPPTKFMGIYNMGKDSVDEVAAAWFGWKNKMLSTYFKDKKIKITEPFTIISGIINLVFFISLISFVLLSGFTKSSSISKRVLQITLSIWLFNMAFSVLAAPIELRYQLFPIIITFCFMLLLISYVVELCSVKPTLQKDNENHRISEAVIQLP
jgi:hypothetical protein